MNWLMVNCTLSFILVTGPKNVALYLHSKRNSLLVGRSSPMEYIIFFLSDLSSYSKRFAWFAGSALSKSLVALVFIHSIPWIIVVFRFCYNLFDFYFQRAATVSTVLFILIRSNRNFIDINKTKWNNGFVV